MTDATTGQPIVGAEVRLYTVPGWSPKQFPGDTTPNTCESNLSKNAGDAWSQPAPFTEGVVANPYSDPISPQVNPQTTNADGRYGWDVGAGCWFIVVLADGYKPLISPVVGVPPAVTDLDVALTPDLADTTPPTVSVTGFTNGDVFKKGASVPTVGCSADDGAGSGVDSVVGPIISAGGLNSNGVGSVTYQCTATDSAGNSASASATYSVIYNFGGFLQPVDALPAVNTVKAGSAVPVKFSLGGNQGLNIFAAGFPKVQTITCAAEAPTDEIESTVTAGSSSLSYDSTSNTYTYVWKTDKAWGGKCRQLLLQFDDGQTHQASFSLRK